MSDIIREYDAKIDTKKRLTLRETPFEYYHVEQYADGRILLEPRELVAPFQVSARTLSMMDASVEHLDKGDVSAVIDLSDFEE